MIVALFALSLAMVIGGIAAIIQGFPFVRLESGLSMVIAGATVASAGAVLAGLGVIAAALRRVERALAGRRSVEAGGAVRAAAPMVPPDLPSAEPAPAFRPTLPPAMPEIGAAGPGRTEPRFAQAPPAIDPEPHAAAPEPDRHAQILHEPELPLPQPAPPDHAPLEPPAEHARAPDPEPAASLAPEDDLFAAPAAFAHEPAVVHEPALRPGLDPAPEHEAAVPAPEPAPEPPHEAVAPPAREVVGRYESGGNVYVMFADGSIEAETPQGRFSFASLDELKAFVEAGGETAARGAA